MPSTGHADAPKLAADSRGRLHLVYGESPEGPFQRYRIRYARREAGSDRFSEPGTIAAPDGGIESVNFPDIAVDAEGDLYVIWELFPDSRHYSDGLGFALSRDGGESFDAPGVVPGTGEPEAGSLMEKLAVNAAGFVALVNSTFIPGRSSHVRLWRKPPAGRCARPCVSSSRRRRNSRRGRSCSAPASRS